MCAVYQFKVRLPRHIILATKRTKKDKKKKRTKNDVINCPLSPFCPLRPFRPFRLFLSILSISFISSSCRLQSGRDGIGINLSNTLIFINIHNFAARHGSDGSLNSPVQAPRLAVCSSGHERKCHVPR